MPRMHDSPFSGLSTFIPYRWVCQLAILCNVFLFTVSFLNKISFSDLYGHDCNLQNNSNAFWLIVVTGYFEDCKMGCKCSRQWPMVCLHSSACTKCFFQPIALFTEKRCCIVQRVGINANSLYCLISVCGATTKQMRVRLSNQSWSLPMFRVFKYQTTLGLEKTINGFWHLSLHLFYFGHCNTSF